MDKVHTWDSLLYIVKVLKFSMYVQYTVVPYVIIAYTFDSL